MSDCFNFDYDEHGNLPKEDVLQVIEKYKKCGFNCWICYFSKYGTRNENHQFPDRYLDCTIKDKFDMLNKLKNDKIEALKKKDLIKSNILTLLHSDALVIAKKEMREVKDADLIKASKSLIKKNKQTIDLLNDEQRKKPLIYENKILTEFLPVQMTEEEIKNAVDIVVQSFDDFVKKDHGKAMKQLKELYGDTINMGVASKHINNELKKY